MKPIHFLAESFYVTGMHLKDNNDKKSLRYEQEVYTRMSLKYSVLSGVMRAINMQKLMAKAYSELKKKFKTGKKAPRFDRACCTAVSDVQGICSRLSGRSNVGDRKEKIMGIILVKWEVSCGHLQMARILRR